MSFPKATINSSGETESEVVWSILSGDSLGTIDSNGSTCVFTPNSTAGEVVIQAKTTKGNVTATCTITILEEQPSTVDLTEEFTWTPGAVLYQDGSISTESDITKSWVYSDFVDISAYDSLTFNLVTVNTTDSPRGFALYDENKQRIYGETNGKGQGVKEITISTNGAKYIRITWMGKEHSRYNSEEGIYHIENFYLTGNAESNITE